MTESQIKSTIEEHLKFIKDSDYVEIAFFGGSFTGIDQKEQIRYLEIANKYIKSGYVKTIRLSTRPDYINNNILEYLKHYNVSIIELGVQSLDDNVLNTSCRGHNSKDVVVASELIKNFGFKLGIQTMIGLPEDDSDKAIETAKRVIELEPDMVRIYPVLVVRGTFLEKMYRENKYIPLCLEEAVNLSVKLLQMYEENNINVIRIGLQATENINENMDVIAGPFHPAFRQLVESKLFLKKIEEKIVRENLYNNENIIIYTDRRNVSNIIGQKKYNIIFLKNKYGFKNIKVIDSIESGYLKVVNEK